MARYVFDLECDGFLDEATRIHCLALKDIDTGEVYGYTPDEVVDGLKKLQDAELMVGHNVIKFDLPVIQKIFPWFHYDAKKVQDTLTLSRLIHSDLYDADEDNSFSHRVEGKLMGSHSLKAWGQRLGLHKGEYTGGFDTFSQEMLDYNIQDVQVTDKLYQEFCRRNVDQRAIDLEHSVAFIVARQERHGIDFDVQKAQQLTALLQKRRIELEAQLQETFPPFYKSEGEFTPKRNDAKKGYTAGQPFTKIKLTLFNPGSRHHITYMLKRWYNWEPKEFTDKGQPKVDETVLGKLPWPEAKLLADFFLVQKRLGMVAEGDNAWLKLVTKAGRIHGSVNTNGAVTGRCTHQSPNLAQVPAVGAPYGAECRELFRAKPGLAQVGIDVSGLELRMLAHYLAKWDNGSYGKIVCEGDIHTANQEAAGLPTRSQAKTFIYGFLSS